MVDRSNSPQNTHAVLGGQNPPPRDSATLGGIEGVRQSFTTGNCEQRVGIIPTALNYGEAGIEFLIEVLSAPELTVRATAYNVLKDVNIEQAQSAIASEFLLHPGDRVYSIYESAITYNDWCYDLLVDVEEIELYYGALSNINCFSRHIFRSSAEIAAKLHHDWRAIQDNVCRYFSQIGWDDLSNERERFNILEWCKNYNVLIRLPDEGKASFEKRLAAAGYSTNLSNCTLNEEMEFLQQELIDLEESENQKISHVDEDREEIEWKIRYELEKKTIKFLQVSQRYELLGQLWLDAIGQLTFIHEETIEGEMYIIPTGKL